MLYFKIGFENGDSFETGFNGTLDEARWSGGAHG